MSLACRNGTHQCEPCCTDDGGAKCTVWKYTNTDLQRPPAMMYECGGQVCFGSTSMLCDWHGSWEQRGTGQPLIIRFHFAGDGDKLKTTLFLFPHLHDNGGRPIYFTGYDYKARFIILLEKKACYRYCRTCCTWGHEPEQEQQPATGWTHVISSMEPEQEQQPAQEDYK